MPARVQPSVTALLPLVLAVQAAIDPEAVVAAMARNYEKALAARSLYSYDKEVTWSATNLLNKVTQHEKRKYWVLGNSLRPAAAECRVFSDWPEPVLIGAIRERLLAPADQSNSCPHLHEGDRIIRQLTDRLIDDAVSPDGIPDWLVPLRTETLKLFRFRFRDQTDVSGRPTYVIEFNPRKKATADRANVSVSPIPWRGTIWIDIAELQPALIASTVARGFVSFRSGPFEMLHFYTAYQRIAEGVWAPSAYCNVVFSGVHPAGTITFTNSNFHRVEVESHIEYVSSSIDYR